jgi:hypothetical protein
MQLDLFIRSFHKYVVNAEDYTIDVIAKYTNIGFMKGYEKLILSAPPNVMIYSETNFKNQLMRSIDYSKPYIVFFVDDDVFVRPVDFFDEQMTIFEDFTKDILCRSLRLSPELNYCYPTDKPMKAPVMDDDNIFRWVGAVQDFGYPMSLDGHIFRTIELMSSLINMKYSNPNSLEGELAGRGLNPKSNMICYNKSIIINNPINKVQDVNNNRHGEVSVEWLNEQYLNGKKIDLEPFDNYNNHACHEIIPITLIDG